MAKEINFDELSPREQLEMMARRDRYLTTRILNQETIRTMQLESIGYLALCQSIDNLTNAIIGQELQKNAKGETKSQKVQEKKKDEEA